MEKLVLLLHKKSTALSLTLDCLLKGTEYKVVPVSSVEAALMALQTQAFSFMLIGNRFGTVGGAGTGDTYVPRLLEVANIPYGRVSALPSEMNPELKGAFTLITDPPGNLGDVRALLDEVLKIKVLLIHKCPVMAELIEDALKGSHFKILFASDEQEIFDTLTQQTEIKFMLIGNRFGNECIPGMGDDYIPRILEVVNIPYARVTSAPNEISEDFCGKFVLDPNNTDKLCDLPTLLEQALL